MSDSDSSEVERRPVGFGALDDDSSSSDSDSSAAPPSGPAAGFAGLEDSSSDDSSDSEAEAPAPVPAPAPAPSKGKAKGKGKGKGKAAQEEDDWELLNAVAAKNQAAAAKKAAAAADAAGTKSKKARRKRGKGAAAADDDDKPAAAPAPAPAPAPAKAAGKPKPLSAAAKAALARKQAKAEEDARIAAQLEAARKAEEEAAAVAAAAAAEEEAEREARRAKRREEIEAQKAAGTYMTKSQRRKAEAARARLDAMRAAGMVVPSETSESGTKAKVVYSDKKSKKKSTGAGAAAAAAPAAPAAEAATPAPAEDKPAAPVVDSWEDLLGGDDDAGEDLMGAGAAAAPATAALASLAELTGKAWDELSDEDLAVPAAGAAAAAAAKPGKKTSKKRRGAAAKDKDDGYDTDERVERSRDRREERLAAAKAERSRDKLRSPICCVMGHVDTGKTKLLDKIRRTNVQEGEAGGITQQIGATYFPIDRLRRSTDKVKSDEPMEYKLPGLLVIDTPGHESFTNLRSRGSSLCDIAVLVVDIMHGLEPQTIESMNLLLKGKTPFIVALNKVDRLYGWKSHANAPIRTSLAAQKSHTVSEFEDRSRRIMGQFAEQGLNACLYYDNKDFNQWISVVPTSAHTGEGVPDLLRLLVQLTQTRMAKRLAYVDYPQATVLEVKAVPGLGTTIDAVLVNGTLHEGDTIVVCGLQGPIVTNVRALLTPPPAKEIRVKAEYVHHKEIVGAMGVKIAAQDLEHAVAGTPLLVLHPDDEVEDLKEEVQEELEDILAGMARESVGVYVQASTIGSLEALMEYLRTVDPPVPVAGVALGPVHKKNIMEASVMLERSPDHAAMLAFDVPVTRDAAALAAEYGLRVFTADIIYHLTDAFENFLKERKTQRQAEAAATAVWPAIARIRADAVYARGNPLLLGMDVLEGELRLGTPLSVITGETPSGMPMVLPLGKVTGLQQDHIDKEAVTPGGPSVAVKVEGPEQRGILYGRHFDHKNTVYSTITRESLDLLKEHFGTDLKKQDLRTLVKLKKVFKVH